MIVRIYYTAPAAGTLIRAVMSVVIPAAYMGLKMTFAATFELSDLDGNNGFRINGPAGAVVGRSVALADLNDDGFLDIVTTRQYGGGTLYVLYGAADGFASILDLSSLDGQNGFSVTDIGNIAPVALAGDLNNDGRDDLLIGASASTGFAQILFGSDSGFPPTFSATTLNGSNGFRINDTGWGDFGQRVASAGDVNNDGIDDIIIGAPTTSGNAGASYVLFGTVSGFPPVLSRTAIDGTNGFQLQGGASGDRAAYVGGAGDINGDGIDDLIVGATYADANGGDSGAAYVVFGRSTTFGATVALSGLDGSNGFRISGPAANARVGYSVAALGDVNGDGLDDIAVSAPFMNSSAGSVYVVFGRTGAYAPDFNLNGLDGANGFRVHTTASYDRLGMSVTGGDVNGDGFADVVIGVQLADGHGYATGGAAIVYGKAGGFSAALNVASLNGTNGFVINGVSASDNTGRSVATGDVNGDGVDDILIGAYNTWVNIGGNYSNTGSAYVIFGQASPVTFVGSAGADSRSGGAAGDNLSGAGGNDVLYGLGGDDLLDGGDLSDLLYGGAGADDLVGGLGGDILYGDDGADELSGGDGADKLYGGTGADNLNGGTGNDRMDGQTDVDTLLGGSGNDYLDGGAGADIMSGGTENDVYIVDDAGDQTIENAGEGYDVVRTAVGGLTLQANIEALELQGTADIDGTGNDGANNIQGNAGANRLSGGAGVDTINGNDGDDTIVGGLGGDLLRGGLGADVFVVAHPFGSPLETDIVYDFSTAEGDRLDFSGVDANSLLAGDQAFTVVAGFSHQAGQMTLSFASGQTTLRVDVNGDGVYDYQMRLNGDVTADSAGWSL